MGAIAVSKEDAKLAKPRVKGTVGILATGTSTIEIRIERRVNPKIIIYKADNLMTPSSLWENINLPDSLKKSPNLTLIGNQYSSGSILPRQPIDDLYKAPEANFDCTIRIFLNLKAKLTVKSVEQL
jgi:hypothetical protein